MASEQQDGQRTNPELEQTAEQPLPNTRRRQRRTRKNPTRAEGDAPRRRRRKPSDGQRPAAARRLDTPSATASTEDVERHSAPNATDMPDEPKNPEAADTPKAARVAEDSNAARTGQLNERGARRTKQRRGRRRRRRRGIPLHVFVMSGLIVVLSLVGVVRWALARGGHGSSGSADTSERVELGTAAEGSVSFCAVGDNLMNGEGDYTVDLLGMADSWAGEKGDGEYDFSPLYKHIKKAVCSYDIAFVSQETTLGGHDGFDYTGYPTYNTPDSLADAVEDAGFDVVNCNTNHTWDTGSNSIEHCQEVWGAHKGITTVGSYASQKDRENIRVLEKDGIKIAFLSYCYGQNGLTQDDLANDYYAAPFDKETMRKEISAAKELADVVVVYMHWGVENDHNLSNEQLEYASFLAGCGVDLTIGSHSHVIQPVQYVGRGIRTTDGSGANAQNGMLCVYGLGDFVSGYTLPKAILSGMFTCDFVRDSTGEVTIQNPTWHGVVEHCADGEDSVYLLEDYTAELAEANQLLARVGENDEYTTSDPLEWARQTTQDVVGDTIPIAA